MLKVVNVIRLYLRDLQSRSFVFVFFVFFVMRAQPVRNGRQLEQLGQHLKHKKELSKLFKVVFKKQLNTLTHYGNYLQNHQAASAAAALVY